MKKEKYVYVVTSGDDHEFMTEGVFTDRDKAILWTLYELVRVFNLSREELETAETWLRTQGYTEVNDGCIYQIDKEIIQ